MANPHRGEVAVVLDGQRHIARLTLGALAELERRELCRSERTAGRFVTDNPHRITALREELSLGAADDFVTRAQGFGLSLRVAQDLVAQVWKAQPPSKEDLQR